MKITFLQNMIQDKYLITNICGILLILVSLIGVLATSVIFELDWNNETLSDMGADNALDTKILFNSSLILGGVFSIIFSIGGIKQNQNIIIKIGFSLLLLSSFVLAGVGIFNLPDPLHVPFASAFFFFSPLALFVMGIGFLQEKKFTIAAFAFIVSFTGFIFTGIMAMAVLDMTFGILNAITEIIVVAAISIWIFYYSLKSILVN